MKKRQEQNVVYSQSFIKGLFFFLFIMSLGGKNLQAQTWDLSGSGFAHIDYDRGMYNYLTVEIEGGLLNYFTLGGSFSTTKVGLTNEFRLAAHADVHAANFFEWEKFDINLGYQISVPSSNLRGGVQYYFGEKIGIRAALNYKLKDRENSFMRVNPEELVVSFGIVLKSYSWMFN